MTNTTQPTQRSSLKQFDSRASSLGLAERIHTPYALPFGQQSEVATSSTSFDDHPTLLLQVASPAYFFEPPFGGEQITCFNPLTGMTGDHTKTECGLHASPCA